MYKLWYDYIEPKYQNNAKLCYMATDSFIVYIKTEDVYEDIADVVEKRFHSDYECNIPLLAEKNEKVIGLIKDELKFALRPKVYSYLMVKE